MSTENPADNVIEVIDNVELSRYEAHIGGRLAGFADYTRTNGTITFPHTETLAEFAGRGVASAVVKYALDDVRARGNISVDPACPFVRDYMERHSEYLDLL